jgi:hypothetical protein
MVWVRVVTAGTVMVLAEMVELEDELVDVAPLGKMVEMVKLDDGAMIVEALGVAIDIVKFDGGLVGVDALGEIVVRVEVRRVVDVVPERRTPVLLNVPVDEDGVGVELGVIIPELRKPVLKANPLPVALMMLTLPKLTEDGIIPELAPPVLNTVPLTVPLEAKGVGTAMGPDEIELVIVMGPELPPPVLNIVPPLVASEPGSAGAEV